MWVQNNCTYNGRDLCKIFNLSVKNWRGYGHFPCCHGNCHLNFIFDVVFEVIETRTSLTYFLVLLSTVLFTVSVFREIRRKALIGNDDVIVSMTS